jgi:hypothetical protein
MKQRLNTNCAREKSEEAFSQKVEFKTTQLCEGT